MAAKVATEPIGGMLFKKVALLIACEGNLKFDVLASCFYNKFLVQ